MNPPNPDKQCRIYRYLDVVDLIFNEAQLEHPPRGLDYKTHLNTSLKPKRTFVQGELQLVEWYAEYTPPEYTANPPTLEVWTDLILRVAVTYVRDAGGFALSRETVRTWIREDGTDAAPTKVTTKYYLGKDRDKESTTRRGNIVQQMKAAVGNHLILSATDPTDPAQAQAQLDIGRDFVNARTAITERFVSLSNQDLYYNILSAEDSPESFLDENIKINPIFTHPALTVRQYLLSELNLWGL